MKVKELIEKLQKMDGEASVVSQEYTGCCHTVHDIETIVFCPKGSKVVNWDRDSGSDAIHHDNGICKKNVVYIN